jgi:hypothetical protein
MSEEWIARAIAVGKEMTAFSPLEKGGADAAYVKASYEDHWGKRIKGLQNQLERGESLAHILANLRPPPHQFKSYNRVAGAIAKAVLAGHEGLSDGEVPLSRLGVSDGHYCPTSNFDPMVAIFRQARKMQNVVELGAGPGWNLFDLCIYLGTAVKEKKLFGLEYTEAGVGAMDLLAKHEALPVFPHRFDYTAPDLSMVPDDGPTLIFSHHSIEQVQDISGDLYKQIAARWHPTTLIHCEPIGWQRFPAFVKARAEQDDDFFRALVSHRKDDLSSNVAPAINAAINSWRVRYNRNALPLMQNAAKDGLLKIKHCYFDFTQPHNLNPVNPSTFVLMAT